ncbi:MAG: ATP-binding cassette domain-containing protein [Bacteroidota bacterium]
MIRSEQLQFAYPGGDPFAFPDIGCEPGKAMLVLGESGRGKTTLLHLLGGLLRPSGGHILIGETDITRLNDRKLDQFRGQHIGIVLQQSHFVDALTLSENLLLTQYLAGIQQDRDRIHGLLEQLNLAHRVDHPVRQLSVGEAQRAVIARALLNQPTLILADEPTSALDDTNANKVMDLLEQRSKEIGACLVIVTHDQRLKDRIVNQVYL